MAELSLEQQRVLALARARLRASQANPPASAGYSSTEPGRTEGDFWRDVQNDVVAQHPVASRVATALQGVPFVGEYADEVVGLFNPSAATAMRVSQEAMRDTRAGQTAGLQVAGAVAGAIPMAAGAAMLPGVGAGVNALAGSGRVAQGLAAGGAGMAAGALEGAVSGYGAGNEGNRLAEAGNRALIGGAVGGAVGVAAPLAAEGIRKAYGYLRGRDVSAIAQTLGISPEAAKAVKQALEGDDLAAASRNIGPDGMLADAGPGSRAMLDAATQTPGPAGRIARDAVDARAGAASTRLTAALDNAMGPASGRADAAEAVRRATAPARKTAFDAAYSTPIDYASPAGQRIEALMGRLPPRQTQAAISAANDLMRFEGLPGQIMASVDDAGRVSFREMPNAVQLHYIKRGFDQIAEAGKDPITGKLSPEAAFAAKVAREVKLSHAAANPAYRQALKVSADSIQLESAIETGYNALRPGTTREMLARDLRGASGPQRQAAAQGVRQYIDDAMANARTILSDPGRTEEIGGAVKAINDLASPASRTKLRTILGQKADALFSEIDEIKTAFELRAALAQNSKTAPRQAVQASVREAAAPGAIEALSRGNVREATQRLVQVFTGATPEMQTLREQGIYAEIARALTEKRGPTAQQALRVIERATAGQPIRDAEAALVARALVTGAAAGGYRAGTLAIGNPQ
jgi:hypothetical protein